MRIVEPRNLKFSLTDKNFLYSKMKWLEEIEEVKFRVNKLGDGL